jgi:putative hydroxymethylpyrimidine transport system substrate-binding protein
MLTRNLRGRRTLLAASLISLTLCVGCGAVKTSDTLGPARHVVISLNGPASALYAPIYEAMANGDFARGALAVRVSTSGSPLTALVQKRAQIAIASEPQLLAARGAGASLVAIGALVRVPLESIISLSSRPITAPRQLVGKVVATNGTPLAAAELGTFLATANVPVSRVRTITRSNLGAALTGHKAVATVGGLWNYDAIALTLAHHKTTVIPTNDAGVPTFTDLAIVVRLDEAHHDGGLLRAFLQSLTRGEAAVTADPSTAATTLVDANSSLSKRFELAVLAASDPVSAPTSAGQPFGFQNPAQWSTFGNWMLDHGLLHGTPNGGFAVTNEFLPGQGE